MQKLQCEVCGGTDIRKMADNVFVCQHCGVQYRTEDMSKLLVEIKDILENIEESVSTASQQPAQSTSCKEENSYYILEAKITPEENVRHFLSYLDKAENIACDIYKELTLEKTKELYLPFFYTKGQYHSDWSAIVCHKYYENETVYEKRYNYELKKTVTEPVTKQVEKIQRTPQNSSQNCNCHNFVPASNVLLDEFSGISKDNKKQLFVAFQAQQNSKIPEAKNLQPFDPAQLRQEGAQFYYGDWIVLNTIDSGAIDDAVDDLRKEAKRIVRANAQHNLNGGYFENYTASQTILAEKTDLVYVPVQVITYRYKEQQYVAVSDLVSTTSTIPAIYPCDTELIKTQETLEDTETQANTRSVWTVLGLASMALEFLAFIFMALMDFQEDAGIFALLAAMLISLIVVTIGLITDANKRKKSREAQSAAFSSVFSLRKLALRDSKKKILDAFPSPVSITEQLPEAGKCCTALFDATPLDYFEEKEHLEEKLILIQQLEIEIKKLEKKRILPLIITFLGIMLVIPSLIGVIILGNINAKLNQKRFELETLKAEFLES